MVDRATRNFAKKLVTLSLDNGKLSGEKVAAVLQVLRQKPPRHYKELLETYLLRVAAEERKENACVEYAGDLEDGVLKDLKTGLEEHYNRAIDMSLEERPDLLAGVRVKIADDVWDASVAGRLEKFAQAVSKEF